MKKLVILAVLAIAGATAGIVACGGESAPAENPSNASATTTSSAAPAESAAPATSGAASAAPAQ